MMSLDQRRRRHGERIPPPRAPRGRAGLDVDRRRSRLILSSWYHAHVFCSESSNKVPSRSISSFSYSSVSSRCRFSSNLHLSKLYQPQPTQPISASSPSSGISSGHCGPPLYQNLIPSGVPLSPVSLQCSQARDFRRL